MNAPLVGNATEFHSVTLIQPVATPVNTGAVVREEYKPITLPVPEPQVIKVPRVIVPEPPVKGIMRT